MTYRSAALAAVLTLTLGTFAPAVAEPAQGTFSIPAVVGGAYHQAGVALNATDVRRQGGLLVPSVTRWDAARPAVAQAEPFKAPGVVTVAYRNPSIALDAAGVLRQGGFATAGVVRWLPAAPVTAEASVGNVRLGSL